MDRFLLFPVFFPMLAGLFAFQLGRWQEKARDMFVLSATAMELLLVLTIWTNPELSQASVAVEGFCALGIRFQAGGFHTLMALLTAAGWLAASVFCREYMVHVHKRNRFYFFWMLTLGATMGVFLSADLFTAFVFFEVMSFTSFVLVIQTEEYQALKAGETYLAVAVIGMDWHLVDVDPKYGSGWTGYTWNKELFPDPAEFMGWLHRHGLKVTLNVHPADGVRAFEDAYRPMAEALGKDWRKEEPVEFDVADPQFLDAYFKYLHHPNEEAGVDFWWVDWQQGTQTRIPGLDPLWMLNHYHYLDSMRDGKRGLTFSRYAGMGSHRYPVGFSGDTIITWESLAFQPYFTANASNAGYGWWSHDIGGHMQGYRDEELSTRWVQFGVFSPIMRLHSSNSPFTGKEPWNFNPIAEAVMKRYLRLRHQLVPYLYTMNWYASRKGQPLIRPLYYLEPDCAEAYQAPNEYYFGTELIACPITAPMDKKAGAAAFTAWLPEGKWFDLFNGRVYDGGRKLTLYRGIEDIPVLAKAGAILPLAELEPGSNSTDNPADLQVKVFAGGEGAFELYEDDGAAEPAAAVTRMTWDGARFAVAPAEGDRSVLPTSRRYTLKFCGIGPETPQLLVNGQPAEASAAYDEARHILTLRAPAITPADGLEVRFGRTLPVRPNDLAGQLFRLLYKAEMAYDKKEYIYRCACAGKTPLELLSLLPTMDLDPAVCGMLSEVLLAENGST